MKMTATVLLTLLLLAMATTVTHAVESNETHFEFLLERQNEIINELLSEIKTQQLKDRKDIESNENEILKLKKENEQLRTIIDGRKSDHLEDGQRETGNDVTPAHRYSTDFRNIKRGMLNFSIE